MAGAVLRQSARGEGLIHPGRTSGFILGMLVSWGCCNKMPLTRWLKTTERYQVANKVIFGGPGVMTSTCLLEGHKLVQEAREQL